jgi:hypothetical protein
VVGWSVAAEFDCEDEDEAKELAQALTDFMVEWVDSGVVQIKPSEEKS